MSMKTQQIYVRCNSHLLKGDFPAEYCDMFFGSVTVKIYNGQYVTLPIKFTQPIYTLHMLCDKVGGGHICSNTFYCPALNILVSRRGHEWWVMDKGHQYKQKLSSDAIVRIIDAIDTVDAV